MVEAIPRLLDPEPVDGGVVVAVALVATALNIAAALVLHEHRSDLNMRSALLHMSADAASSLGVATAGLVILVTGGFEWLDPAISIAIGLVIVAEAWRLMRSAVDVLLEAAPSDIDLAALREAMAGVDGVADVHDLHVWSLSSAVRVLTAHVVIADASSLEAAQSIGGRVKAAIEEPFGIAHATIELEAEDFGPACLPDEQRHVPD